MSHLFVVFWKRKTEANPSLAEGDVMLRISVESFRKQLEIAFQAGREAQQDLHARANELREKYGKTPFEQLFGRHFGHQ